ncbi:MAG: class I SAM-dependent methyltransferase [Planctomycetota bacterium]
MAGLSLDDFRQVGVRGVGDPRNSYAHSMAWFRNRMFVGSARDSLCLMKRPGRKIPPPKMDFWPVKCADPEVPDYLRAQVLRYDPAGDSWHLPYRSPMIEQNGQQVQRDVGYRGMIVHQGRSDKKPCLYVGSISATGARILRSIDGERFEVTTVLPGPSIRTFASFGGRLFTSIVGQTAGHGNESAYREVWESGDPVTGEWRPASEPGFGDSSNASVFELCEFNGFLYAGTMNPVGGFQVWKTNAEGKPPYAWQKVLGAGAFRGFLNEFALSMCAFQECLYIGSGIAGGGYDRIHRVGPAPAELVRLHADDEWDLIVGAPRVTPQGLKVPLSGLGPGFDNCLNGYTWRMCAHEDHLYAGTFNSAAFLKYRPHALGQLDEEQFAMFEALLPTGSLERFAEEFGGCHLWRTGDGVHYEPVTRNGFGSSFNMGVRQMTSSPYGLFVGTANSFGPEVGVKKNGEWRYEENPRGGMEIWLGSCRSTPTEPVMRHESREREEEHRHAMLRVERQMEQQVSTIYLKDLYDRSGFFHIGYWADRPATLNEACEALVDRLVPYFGSSMGLIVDAACGCGATSRRLANHLDADRIVGIDDSPWLLEMARFAAPGVRFQLMDPSRMSFADRSVGNVVCVEGGPMLDTRNAFLKEAARVLKPGGSLVMADILWNKDAVLAHKGRYHDNYVRDVDAYRELFHEVGFKREVTVVDITQDTVGPYMQYVSDTLTHQYREGVLTEGKYSAAMACASRRALFVRNYVIVAARIAR